MLWHTLTGVNDKSEHSPALAPHMSESQVLEIALKMAAQAGENQPTLVQYAEGDRVRANLVASGAGVFEHQMTYLIAMRGQFICTSGSRPPGSTQVPRGTVMTLVVDTATGRQLDIGISDRYPLLEELGPVVTALP